VTEPLGGVSSCRYDCQWVERISLVLLWRGTLVDWQEQKTAILGIP
jgi:hypothetical protein